GGRSILICDYPWRARYREGFDHEALLEPGKVHKLEFDVGWMSQVFNAGHQIRVTISSTGAPLYEPNPQTGGPLTIEMPNNPVKAENKIHHNRMHASRIIAPVTATNSITATTSRIRYVPEPVLDGVGAVIVGDVPLVHTAQLLPESAAVFAAQVEQLVVRLESVLLGAGSDSNHLVKLNWYLANGESAEFARREVEARFPRIGRRPAMSYVVTALPSPHAQIALDAVATTSGDPISAARQLSRASVMPAGRRLYVSGQAERADSLREATRKTLESLITTLKHCGRSNRDIVQLKCFFQPMSAAAEVRNEINRYFGDEAVPPISLVEWKAASPPIEIELVAWGGPTNNDAKEVLEFITPPGVTASPVFSRVARINRGGTIFIGDIASSAKGSADEQLQVPFEALGKLLVRNGSNFKHLAKATYYVTDDEIGKAHNAIRPKYYDATRPPAASKAIVAGTGHPGSRYVMDMIAVPSER
ncbi:MAG TPA: Rid family hydrolase, partial [Pirellulaceae bacterium]|nr:Rid family hydrolase [Pirellulaceae bacterium]